MNQRYYLAYGSNLNVQQMAQRCPDAIVAGAAELPGYELVFRGHRIGAVATIEPRKGCSVPVGIWQISGSDEKRLDIYEGYPHLYEKKLIKVSLNGKIVTTMAYIMPPDRVYGIPSPYYFNTIAAGYEIFGFDISVLEEATEKSRKKMEKDAPCHSAAEKTLHQFAKMQKEKSISTCPRCGKDTMKSTLYYNALSRRYRIYICDQCGMQEALCDFAGKEDSITKWYAVSQETSCNKKK